MKSSRVGLLAVGCAIAMVATGCKNPQNTRTMYGRGSNMRQDENPGPPIEGPITPTQEVEPKPMPPFDPTTWTHDTTTFEAQTIYYGYDSATIKVSEKMKAQFVAGYLQTHPNDAVLIEGNCDERGTEEYNRALGERRALAAREALLAAGIAPERVDLISYGEDKPVEAGHDEAAWQKNRRAAFVLLTAPK